MKRKLWWLIIPVVITAVYFFGPSPETPVYDKQLPEIPVESDQLVNYVRSSEARHKLKPDNEARIIWANDSLKNKTEYSIVYLHGFSASQGEGEPIHRNIAKKFGYNMYLSRLAEHGIDTVERMVNLTSEKYWESAKRAFAIAKQLGKKVILMGTSTGGTLALLLAGAYPDDVAAIVLLSPNIKIFAPEAFLLNNHWGLQIAQTVTGSDYITSKDTREMYKKYWNSPYRLEAACALQELLETSMTKENFAKVKQPLLLLYYYKDKIHQDSVVRVDAMLQMFTEVSTPTTQKREVAMPNTGDHVIGSSIKSKDVEGVQREIENFLKEQLKK